MRLSRPTPGGVAASGAGASISHTESAHSSRKSSSHDRSSQKRSFLRSLVLGREEGPSWVRPALLALLAATAVLYLWDLGASGWANSYYSAAVQAASKSWKAWFFGSFDASNFITVDKPPFSLWVMGLSARIFGVNAWSILVPQALMGVASVGLLYATVRRWATPAAGLLAGAVLALTPAAALMFRFNNPDALLVLLLVAAAYCTVRAVEKGSTWWLVSAAALVGCGFNTKMLQAFLVIPAFLLVYLVAAKPRLLKRLWQLGLAAVALVASSGWWVAIVELWPASSRPYIGGSQNNSMLELIFGYNGFGRITGNETGSVGGMGGGGGGGETGWTRLFDSDWGPRIAWLLPAAAILGLACLWISRRGPRTDRLRASVLLWGGWLVVTWAVFSFGSGIIHSYYAIALAPAIGALVGIGIAELWRRRDDLWARLTLAAALAGTSVWSFYLLDLTPTWLPALRYIVLIGGVTAAVGLVVAPMTPPSWRRRIAVSATTLGAVAAIAGPTAYAVVTAGTPLSGSLPAAGPTMATAGPSGVGMPGGTGDGGGMPGAPGGQQSSSNGSSTSGNTPPGMPGTQSSSSSSSDASPSNGSTSNGSSSDASPSNGSTSNGSTNSGSSSDGSGQMTPPSGSSGGQMTPPGSASGGMPGGTTNSDGPRGGGNMGGLLNASTPSSELVELLQANADQFDWVLAIERANAAAGYQLASGEPVMAMGGFNGTDPAPTLAQFKAYVKAGRIHYYIGGGESGGPGGGSSSSSIAEWVQSNFSAQTVDGVALYDLTDPL